MWSTLTMLAFAEPSLVVSEAIEGPARKRLAEDPADLVILYAGEQDGSQDPCGCPVRPRGSLGRLEAYASAVRDAGAPVLLVNAGNWLKDAIGPDDRLRADTRVADEHMLSAVEAGSWTALNVTFRDLPYLAEAGRFPDGAVLANARGPNGPAEYVLVRAGERTVAITGVTSWSKEYLQPTEFHRTDPVDALAALLPTLREQADLVVVLGYGLGKRAKEIAALGVDVLVEADTYRTRSEPILLGDTLWVRSNYGTQRLGELRLRLADQDGRTRVSSAHDRAIDLDADIKMDRSWKQRSRKAREAIEATQDGLYGAMPAGTPTRTARSP
jgi:2',3'-cyclic-nucleotide 2'-phosphodiesterase (5'-nucleotidase family)